MGAKRKITVGVGGTVTVPVAQQPGLCVLKCMSQNPMIATCVKGETSVSITGQSPGTTMIVVITGTKFAPVMQTVFIVHVVEEDEE